MRLPRKSVLIRIVIYGSLLGYFGWQALQRYQLEQDHLERQQEQSERAKQLEQLGGIPTFEITPEQAREMYGIEVDDNGHIVDGPAKTAPAPGADTAAAAEPAGADTTAATPTDAPPTTSQHDPADSTKPAADPTP